MSRRIRVLRAEHVVEDVRCGRVPVAVTAVEVGLACRGWDGGLVTCDPEARPVERAQHVDVVDAILARLVDAYEGRPNDGCDLPERFLRAVRVDPAIAVVGRHLVGVVAHVVVRVIPRDRWKPARLRPVVDERVVIDRSPAPIERCAGTRRARERCNRVHHGLNLRRFRTHPRCQQRGCKRSPTSLGNRCPDGKCARRPGPRRGESCLRRMAETPPL